MGQKTRHLLSNATREAEAEGSGAEGASHTNVVMMVPCCLAVHGRSRKKPRS